jgi:hypothetical protein
MLINICFGFMMLIASLIESPIAKTRMSQKHNTHFANFDKAGLPNVTCLGSDPIFA